ncbi:MAG: glycosyltransferase [Thermoguttaceae bacterium]|jgi:processive 1,2-diacylglycerol beta-glucosyltransferase
MSRRILVLSASVGAGHLRAAEAVEAALRQVAPDAVVKNLDVLELTNAAFRRVYSRTYFELVNKAPHVLGYVYDLLDQPPSARRKADRLRLLVERLNLRRFSRLLRSESWDVIVNTHFLPAEIIAAMRRRDEIATGQLTVTTDFETHRLWVNQPCEHYFTATEEGAAYLAHWGVPPGQITVSGIPIHPVFSEAKSGRECRAGLGLADDRPVILQLAGGFGLGPVEKLFQGLLSMAGPLAVIVVSGRNEELQRRLEQIEVPPRHQVKILGFTTQMDELMAAADVVLSKPGGLTTSEVLARGAALMIANPIPGQEARNSDFLLENGAAIKVNNIATLPYKLAKLLDDPARLAGMKANARRLGRPQAAFDVARFALAWGQP